MFKQLLIGGLAAALMPLAQAGSISVVGHLDPNDANDVALILFTLTSAADVDVQTWGYGGTGSAPGGVNAAGAVVPDGGFDPYVSLFDGVGSGATFLASNDDGLCPPGNGAVACHDSTLHVASLAAGSYTLALSTFSNDSFAENTGSGTLGDGFIGLGNYYDASTNSVRSSNYAVDITSNGIPAVPEPSALVMLCVGALVLSALRA